jgi:hypothetical protein
MKPSTSRPLSPEHLEHFKSSPPIQGNKTLAIALPVIVLSILVIFLTGVLMLIRRRKALESPSNSVIGAEVDKPTVPVRTSLLLSSLQLDCIEEDGRPEDDISESSQPDDDTLPENDEPHPPLPDHILLSSSSLEIFTDEGSPEEPIPKHRSAVEILQASYANNSMETNSDEPGDFPRHCVAFPLDEGNVHYTSSLYESSAAHHHMHDDSSLSSHASDPHHLRMTSSSNISPSKDSPLRGKSVCVSSTSICSSESVTGHVSAISLGGFTLN